MLYFPVVTGDMITLLCRIASLQLHVKIVPILFGNKWSISLQWSIAPQAARQLGFAPGRGSEKILRKGTGIPNFAKAPCAVSKTSLQLLGYAGLGFWIWGQAEGKGWFHFASTLECLSIRIVNFFFFFICRTRRKQSEPWRCACVL